MIDYRIHGRGGQGNVAAAYLLASAAFEAGFMCQAFPAFGAERRGAPVTAFVRISREPIHQRSQVRNPDYVIVQDDTLLASGNPAAGLTNRGGMLVNSARDAADIADQCGCRVVTVPATDLAVDHIGRPIPNTALLAALLSLTGTMPLGALEAALKKRFSGPTLEKNLALVADAAQIVPQGAWGEMADA